MGSTLAARRAGKQVRKRRQIPDYLRSGSTYRVASRRRGGGGCDRCSYRCIGRFISFCSFVLLSCIGIAKADQLRQLLRV